MYERVLTLRTFKNLETILKISGKDLFFFPTGTDICQGISSFTEQGILHNVSHIKKKKKLS